MKHLYSLSVRVVNKDKESCVLKEQGMFCPEYLYLHSLSLVCVSIVMWSNAVSVFS